MSRLKEPIDEMLEESRARAERMSKPTHAHEPWTQELLDDQIDVKDAKGRIIATVDGKPDCEQTAARIIACINALAGIPTEALEAGALNEVVEALELMLGIEWATYEGNLDASGYVSVDDLNTARAALAKVRP